MNKIDSLIKTLTEFKEELNKNMNMSYGSSNTNMAKESGDQNGEDSKVNLNNPYNDQDDEKKKKKEEKLDKAASKATQSSPVVGIPAEQVKAIKIKNLQSQIDNKTYKPDASKIADKMLKEERLACSENGQWDIEKYDMEKRCWEGYKPTPGKKAYEKGSCQPMSKEEAEIAPKGSNNKKTFEESFSKSTELSDNEFEITEWDNGDIDIEAGQSVSEEDFSFLCKSVCEKADCEEMDKKEWSPKAEHKSDKGGLTAKGRESYNKATGGNLKAPQPGGGSRKKSFCARNGGQIKMHNIDCKADPDKRACKARRRWKC